MSNDTVYLPWTRMRPSRLNRLVRGDVSPDAPDIKELAASIRDHGVMQNVTVVELFPPVDGVDYEVMIGERRWQACRLLDGAAPPLPCTIIPRPTTDLDALLLMGAENMQRKNLSPIEEARYFQALIDLLPDQEKARPAAALARRLRKRRGYIEDRLAVLDLEAEVQDEVERGTLSISAVKHLARLAGDDQVEVALEGRGLKTARIKELVEAKQRARNGAGGGLCRGRPSLAPVMPYQVLATTQGVDPAVLNLALKATCGACLVAGVSAAATDVPWDDLKGAFAASCRTCKVRDIKEACLDCPLIEFLKALGILLQERGAVNTLAYNAPDHLYQRGILERRAEEDAGRNQSPQVAAAETTARAAVLSLVG